MRRPLYLLLLLLLVGALLSACTTRRRGGGGGGGFTGGADDDDAASDDDDFSDGPDSDGDGLSDAWEDEHGTDPDDVDSDGDGWEDGEEVTGNSDPLDDDDHPYLGGWPRSPIPDWLLDANTANYVGSTAPNFALMDQFGELVNLWSFVGNVILIESVAEW
jgi:hypothetical protein